MAHSLLRILAVSCLLCVCTAATARPHSASRTAQKPEDPNIRYIRQAYAYMDSGWENRSVKIMTAYMTPDFVHTALNGGSNTRDEYARVLYKTMTEFYTQNSRLQADLVATSVIKRAAISGQQIVIDRVQYLKARLPEENDGATPQYRRTVAFHDVWVRLANGWYLQNEKVAQLSSEHE
jgi:hypothetical protein